MKLALDKPESFGKFWGSGIKQNYLTFPGTPSEKGGRGPVSGVATTFFLVSSLWHFLRQDENPWNRRG